MNVVEVSKGTSITTSALTNVVVSKKILTKKRKRNFEAFIAEYTPRYKNLKNYFAFLNAYTEVSLNNTCLSKTSISYCYTNS